MLSQRDPCDWLHDAHCVVHKSHMKRPAIGEFVESHQLQPTPHAYDARIWGDPLEFSHNLWCQKTRFPGLSRGIGCIIKR